MREAEGEAQRFDAIEAEYRKAPAVTRQRLYTETMERILRSSNKVVIDTPKGGTAPHRAAARPAAEGPASPRGGPRPGAPGAAVDGSLGMTSSRLMVWGVALVALLIVVLNSLYVVDQRKQAVVLRFGEPQRVVNAFRDNDPGLKLKVPFVENVILLDKRNQAMEADQEEIIAADQERLVVDAFLRYRISDPLQFFRTLRDERTAVDRLERLVNSSLRQVLGTTQSNNIIAGRRDELMRATRADVAKRAEQARLGIEVIDVRIKRADLPQANQEAVYRRMQTSRQQEAAQIRAVGEQQKREIMAAADRDVTITLAQATEQSSKLRGDGDARRVGIYASAYGKDPGFARLLPLAAGVRRRAGAGRHHAGDLSQRRLLQVFQQRRRGGGALDPSQPSSIARTAWRSGATWRQRLRISSVASSMSGTMTVIIPAAAAERTPLWLSSSARQYCGSTPSRRAASR